MDGLSIIVIENNLKKNISLTYKEAKLGFFLEVQGSMSYIFIDIFVVLEIMK